MDQKNVVYFLLDDSASIDYYNISQNIRDGINDVIRRCLDIDPDLFVGISTINRGFLGWTQWVADRLNVHTYGPKPGSKIYDAIIECYQNCNGLDFDKKVLVILIDGDDEDSIHNHEDAIEKLHFLQRNDWKIFAIELNGSSLDTDFNIIDKNSLYRCERSNKKKLNKLLAQLSVGIRNYLEVTDSTQTL